MIITNNSVKRMEFFIVWLIICIAVSINWSGFNSIFAVILV